MKYIRTEDRIYKTDGLTKCEDARFPNGWFNGNGAPLVAKKEADNIAELCDFVCFKSKKVNEMIVVSLTGNRSVEHLEWYMRSGNLDMLRLMILVGKDLRCAAEMDKEGDWRLV